MRQTETRPKAKKAYNYTAYWKQDYMREVLSNGYCSFAKLMFMRIASFGESGCWMNNETLAEEFNRSERTIRRAISSLWEKGDIIITGWDGHGRKMYARKNPRVMPILNEQFRTMVRIGKVKDLEEWYKKVRYRRPISNPQK